MAKQPLANSEVQAMPVRRRGDAAGDAADDADKAPIGPANE
jgi:hypothetical protein